jgi:hypothetical protein
MRTVAASLVGLFLVFCSCASVKPVAKTGVTALINCESAEVQQLAPSLLPQVQEILRDGSVNYQNLLDQLIGTQEEALACAVQEAWKTFIGHARASADPYAHAASSRADDYIRAKGYSFQNE